ncbi:hypothetical protein OP10G_1406 [Fimbriimonas ginsengisoli Gsoil 348]|uniref:HNH endonuclease 5 domain-containing protein n=1 Tax=Fimbriimonas ginsengisoli Gsoil 348 TaxID=661478 RepID=A0A068NT17_FIMGI|nr:hypothetical protein OP10G_1406 [Fimbriimonas ginsengisoli Gsoil 348]
MPPQSAFNKQTARIETFEEAMQHHPLDPTGGKIKQGGVGLHTLCTDCNSKTGALYVNEYTSWANQAAQLLGLDDSPKEPQVFKGYPGRFLKQVVTLFMSVDHPRLIQRHPDFYHYLMLKNRTRLPRGIRIYAYLNPSTKGRTSNNQAITNIETHKHFFFLEFAFFPFGFVLTEKSPPPDDRLVDITELARYSYDDYAELPLFLPSFPVISQFAGIYHPMDEVRNIRKPVQDGDEDSGPA